MKTWRVGTFSMGASLVFLGVFLLLTQIFQWDSAYIMMSWWPALLIVLGLEILIYLNFSKQENSFVKYDVLSILFVGIIGVVGIGLTLLTTTGVLAKVTEMMNAEYKTVNLPSYDYKISDNIKRIVVETGTEPVTIEGSPESQVSLFGTYQADIVKDQEMIKSVEDYMMVVEKGDTLYMNVKKLSDPHQPFLSTPQLNPILLIPSDVKLEVKGQYNSITVKPRLLKNNWSIEEVSDVDVQVLDKADVMIHAVNIDQLQGSDWLKKESGQSNKTGDLKMGEGTYKLNISNANMVNVTKQP